MLRPATPYSVCTDPACRTRACLPCSQEPPIHSGCVNRHDRALRCPTSGEWHPCRCGCPRVDYRREGL